MTSQRLSQYLHRILLKLNSPIKNLDFKEPLPILFITNVYKSQLIIENTLQSLRYKDIFLLIELENHSMLYFNSIECRYSSQAIKPLDLSWDQINFLNGRKVVFNTSFSGFFTLKNLGFFVRTFLKNGGKNPSSQLQTKL